MFAVFYTGPLLDLAVDEFKKLADYGVTNNDMLTLTKTSGLIR